MNNSSELEFKIKEMTEYMERAAKKLVDISSDSTITLISHNDTDGLCAGTILNEVLNRKGFQVEWIYLGQLYPNILEKIYDNTKGSVIITDLGVRAEQKNYICGKCSEFPTIILDHHEISSDESIDSDESQNGFFDINCTSFGIDGDRYASASSIAYYFATFIENIDDFSHLAILGAFSDKNHTMGDEKGRFSPLGLDSKILVRSANVNFEEDIYKIRLSKRKKFDLMDQIVMDVNLLGSIGHQRTFTQLTMFKEVVPISYPMIAIELLQSGYNQRIYEVINQLGLIKNNAYEGLINDLKQGNYRKHPGLLFFNSNEFFKGMSIKTIGNFCSSLLADRFTRELDFIDSDSYLIGAQSVEPIFLFGEEISAFSEEDILKISIRTTGDLQNQINSGKKLSVFDLLNQLNTINLGSSHRFRGSAFVKESELNEFLDDCSKKIEKYSS